MLNELTADQLKAMDIASLVQRMDEVRIHAEEERYGKNAWDRYQPPLLSFPLVGQLMATQLVAGRDDQTKRKLADCAFRYLLQMDLLSVSGGIANKVLYGETYNVKIWKSPAYWMKNAVIQQYDIVASRIALECFFDLIYMLDVGQRMSGDKKFKEFKKWILNKDNQFTYFVGHIVEAFKFDREHRQKEVHGTSRFARSLLTLHQPDFSEHNISSRLENVLLSVWHPLLQILDGQRPTTITTFGSCREFAEEYFKSFSDPNGFSEFIREFLESEIR